MIAVVGLVLSLASLVWQAVTYRLSGPRIRVELQVGATQGNNYATLPASADWRRELQQLQDQDLRTAFVAVFVRNIGRQATTVVRYRAVFDTGKSFGRIGAPPQCPPLPYRLEAESEVLYYLPLQDCIDMARKMAVSPETRARHLQMQVELGSGKVLTTKERLSAPELTALADE